MDTSAWLYKQMGWHVDDLKLSHVSQWAGAGGHHVTQSLRQKYAHINPLGRTVHEYLDLG